ncbi:MAG: hypothetical protein II837_05970 [Treponema sp.]|nr:hypothetical protein [Treponema sp.]MBQ6566859.1 hypothetical protein [Treponema sp.]MBQ7167910.1 hypothetical protein [Treponema sp.]
MTRNGILGIVWLMVALTLSLLLSCGLTGDAVPLIPLFGKGLLSLIFY